jgi:dipeptidyl aminopeptidase/acylaminoacyl peptidase
MAQWGDAAYYQLIKAKSADTYLYTCKNTAAYFDYYVTGHLLQNGQKITDANPQQKNFLWSEGVRIGDYTSARGEKLQGTFWLPANYEAGKRYPMLVYI